MPFAIDIGDLQFAYVLGLIITLIGSGVVIAKVVNPPYHQLKAAGIPDEDNVKISKWLGQQMLPNATTTLADVSV